MGADVRLTHPKHQLVDPAIAARLVGVGKAGLLRGDGTRGCRRDEDVAGRTVRVAGRAKRASRRGAINTKVGHLRTKNTEDEIDQGDDRQVVAIEVNLALLGP